MKWKVRKLLASEIYTLEDKNDYELIDTIEEDNNTYLLLAEVNNLKNIVLRNLVYNPTNGEEYIERIEEDKFEELFSLFMKKNKDLFN